MRRCLPLVLLCCLSFATPAHAKRGGRAAGRVLRPRADRTDTMLFAKAMRIQAGMWKHLSPEGLLVYRHVQGADPEQLSRDALDRSDAAIWTGCYAAAQAARWHVTRDPDALAQVRHLARGLALLSEVTGVPGRLCRTVGRLAPGAVTPKHIVKSAARPALWYRPDVSRDQLAGVTLGWTAIARFVEDEALRTLARDQLSAIAVRLSEDHMWLRDERGRRTEHGELRADTPHMPLMKNGPWAAIGYAPAHVAVAIQGSAGAHASRRYLDRKDWREALGAQQVWFTPMMTASNALMVALSLSAIRLYAGGKASDQAGLGLRQIRTATTGWWNGGIAACCLLGRLRQGRKQIADEVRVCLHVLGENEIPPRDVRSRVVRRIATLRERGNSTWAWKSRLDKMRVTLPDSPSHPTITHTRADWLFAYWISRAAGELTPSAGPGAQAGPHLCPVEYPAWMAR